MDFSVARWLHCSSLLPTNIDRRNVSHFSARALFVPSLDFHRDAPPRRRFRGPDNSALRRGRLRRGEIASALSHALEEFVTFAQPADANVLVFQHRLDDA